MATESAPDVIAERRLDTLKYSKRVALRSIIGLADGGSGVIGERAVIGGWVKACKVEEEKKSPASVREDGDVTYSKVMQNRVLPCFQNIVRIFIGGNIGFRGKLQYVEEKKEPTIVYLQVNDGSCVSSLQVVVDSSLCSISQVTAIGTSILVEGVLRQPKPPGKRGMELKVEKIFHVGISDVDKYPLAKTRLPLEFLRTFSHLRPRKTMVASITRIRSALSYATHNFFQNHGFLYVNMPIITSVNSSDSNEPFQVTTLLCQTKAAEEPNATDSRENVKLQVVKTAIKEKSDKVQELKRNVSDKEALIAAIQDLEKTKKLASQLESQEMSKSQLSVKDGKLNFSDDYFSQRAYLTASAQLHLESYACALSNVYTFGPTFRADKSHSKSHLAESWMVELEMAFAELEDAMNCAEDYMKFLCQWVLENCMEDMKIMSKAIDKASIYRLQSMVSTPFERVTYTEAIEVLEKVTDKTFETQIEWGIQLAEEHESYLVDVVYKRPVIVYDFPKETKPFYVRVNDNGRTVAAFDVILPKVGILIRGSQKEERLDMINKRVEELGLALECYEWYFDIRKHGGAQHSGFSLGFERMVMFATGISDIRDAIPFPRTFGRFTC